VALHFPTRAERPDKLPHADSLAVPNPAFINEGAVLKRLFGRVVAEYPELERYLSWRRPDGTHLDPWLRTHERLRALSSRWPRNRMRSQAPWRSGRNGRRWRSSDSGAHVVPGALVPFEIDHDRDEGLRRAERLDGAPAAVSA